MVSKTNDCFGSFVETEMIHINVNTKELLKDVTHSS